MMESDEPTQKKKRILHSFTLQEISAVDQPAQHGARATIMKKADDNHTSFGSFEEACELIKRTGSSSTDAMRKAADRYPELLAKYQAYGDERAEKAQSAPADVQKAVRDFRTLVDQIAAERKVGKAKAIQLARQQSPELFAKYQSA